MSTFFMDTVLDPFIAMLGIVIPLGLAYVILFLQSHSRQGENRNECNPTKETDC